MPQPNELSKPDPNSSPVESALVVPIPEVESLVESFRLRYDPSACMGVPAHVTVLYPFKAPQELSPKILATLQEIFQALPAFRASFENLRRFPDTLYLAPQPAEAFRRMTRRVAARFPETPPYRGEFAEVVPHLTVAQAGDPEELDRIAQDFQKASAGKLPVLASIRRIVLFESTGGLWRVRAQFRLGRSNPTG